MRRCTTLPSLALSLAALTALGASLYACGGEGSATGGASGSGGAAAGPNEQTLTGVTSDGTPIIFAGKNRRRVTQGRNAGPRPYDAERLINEPNEADPNAGGISLEEAVVGLPIDGKLVAEIGTDFGTLFCELDAERMPRTVANFVGLARAKRAWWDARAGQWRRNNYYHGTFFFRAIPGFMIQGGDYLNDGQGQVGYTIENEGGTQLHDRAGQLALANREGNGAQFIITDGPAPQLDGGYPIFGQCSPTDLISQIARVPQDPASEDNRPIDPIRINRFLIRRVVGGLAAARPTPPERPPGWSGDPRGASPPPGHGPGEVRRNEEGRRYPEPSPLPRHGGPPWSRRPHNH